MTELIKRSSGLAVFLPDELGYACPLCGACDEIALTWSEYLGFLWCYKCQLDIPSALCVKYVCPKLDNTELSEEQKIMQAIKITKSLLIEYQEVKNECR